MPRIGCAIGAIGAILGIVVFVSCSSDEKNQTERSVAAALTSTARSVTVINSLPEKHAQEYSLTTVVGELVAHENQVTVENFVFDGLRAFKDETEFKITLIDRYGLKYEEVFEASLTGNTVVVIDESDYVEQSGDWKRKLDRFVNN